MNKTQRTVGIAALVALGALGTGWALEEAYSHAGSRGAGRVIERTSAGDRAAAPSAREPQREPAPARVSPARSEPEYDRSDLLLSQG